mmetsp:Transcript_23992/g.66484  ORF Transcript_23992/g.66484 Transcript_23992/m.66484 type:complete len:125 (-) Transcript_23992:72-446(-)
MNESRKEGGMEATTERWNKSLKFANLQRNEGRNQSIMHFPSNKTPNTLFFCIVLSCLLLKQQHDTLAAGNPPEHTHQNGFRHGLDGSSVPEFPQQVASIVLREHVHQLFQSSGLLFRRHWQQSR